MSIASYKCSQYGTSVYVTIFSPLGIETYLTLDKLTGKLVAAEQIDGEWIDLDLDWAEEQFKDILDAVKAKECKNG